MDTAVPPLRSTPKSHRTRTRILDTALSLFAEQGYHAVTNAVIAKAARLTRGAMLYHFPSRETLVTAAIAHIEHRRATLLEAAAAPPASGVDASDHAIDAYWALLQTPPFLAFAELEAAARTDSMLAELLRPAQSAFDHAQLGGEKARRGDLGRVEALVPFFLV